MRGSRVFHSTALDPLPKILATQQQKDIGLGRFDGQVVIVTGGGRGIGRATALRFATEGANVVVADVDTISGTEVAASIQELGARSMAVTCDVQDESSVSSLVKSTLVRFGKISVLVSNAGIARDTALAETSSDEWDAVIRVNTTGAFLCARAVARNMMANRSGKIVFLSSASARGHRWQASYATSKASLHGLTRTLALELGPFQINVNCVAPGHVDTPMSRVVAERLALPLEDFLKEAAERIPLGRVGQPEDIAAVIAFLCSTDASYISGQVLYVNGGRQIL
ncbi:MAG: 3-oxoacyl-ACP reductase FabG [Candidatus Dormiibacterota bacterium]